LIVSALNTDAAFLSWGWRIGFVLSVGLILIGLIVHLSITEPDADTPAANLTISAAVERRRSPLLEVLVNHWRVVLLAGGAFVANNVSFYVAITYAIAYGSTTVGIDRDLLLFSVLGGSALMIPVLLLCGAASDRFGRLGVFLWGAFLSGIWAFAVFPLIETAQPVAIFVAITVQLLFVSMMYGPQTTGGAVRGALSEGGPLFRRLARIPDWRCRRRRIRPDHRHRSVRSLQFQSADCRLFVGNVRPLLHQRCHAWPAHEAESHRTTTGRLSGTSPSCVSDLGKRL
jgi:hypothetical protein